VNSASRSPRGQGQKPAVSLENFLIVIRRLQSAEMRRAVAELALVDVALRK